MAFYIIITFIISVFVAWLTIPRIVIISRKKRLFDLPDHRKVHSGAIPRLGGMSFFPGMLLSFTITLGLRYLCGDGLGIGSEKVFIPEFMFFFAGLISLFFVGMSDDLVGVSYYNKLLVQIFASLLLVSGGVYLKSLYGFLGIWDISAFAGIPITVFIVILIVNAFNLIDGVDGLCSGLSSIALATLSGWFWYHHQYVYACLGVGLLGTLVVFFLYNVTSSRLKIFMGDGGSLMLGFVISYLGLKFCNLNAEPLYQTNNAPVLLLSLVFVPVFDTIRVFFDRLSRRVSPFYPDKTHIHHYILQLGYSHLQSTAIMLIISIAFVMLNFLLQNIDINILFLINVVLGFFVLNYIPKKLVAIRKRKGKINKYFK